MWNKCRQEDNNQERLFGAKARESKMIFVYVKKIPGLLDFDLFGFKFKTISNKRSVSLTDKQVIAEF